MEKKMEALLYNSGHYNSKSNTTFFQFAASEIDFSEEAPEYCLWTETLLSQLSVYSKCAMDVPHVADRPCPSTILCHL